ncbi:acetyltransferase [Campylobacter mucosalis]|uniref:UDP-4-amino-4, 6-dideoxy-alpha-D-N-acetyl-D-glucosamine N-acetyltransferase n=1 Tax=Campylobacter mucosalis CCUG 21559 TaxID=1032067 RepID=A0A6G5QFU1_9BACT|nr:acetyltransferase [Campylobacter mucosalis]QCD44521.1 UDP-4-amino-4,6-dideoxy-alpha-D-N-acetyl-D-glucosamine N-acetyltransferase [Campylobacter mucosalis CCUG 21559]
MAKIYIYGSSGHGLVCADVASSVGYDEIVFLDDKSDMKFSPNLPKADIFIAVGDNKTRSALTKRVLDAGFSLVSLVHKSAVISQSVVIERGVVVMPNSVINAKAVIKMGAIINTAAVIEHECVVGEFAHISPNVALAGAVKVGDFTHVGIGSSVIQGINIGSGCIIGAGSVVVRDIKDNVKAYGNPARAVISKI